MAIDKSSINLPPGSSSSNSNSNQAVPCGQSGPPASDNPSDDHLSESEIDPAETEAKLQQSMRQMIVAERDFQRIIHLLRSIKLRQIEQKRSDIANGTSRELTKKNAAATEQYENEIKIAELMYQLELESLKRKTDAMRAYVKTSQEDNKIALKERMMYERGKKIVELEYKIKNSMLIIRTVEKAVAEAVKIVKRRESVDEEALLRRKRPRRIRPLLVSELSEHEIEEDMELFDYAVLKSKLDSEFDAK